MQRTSSRQLQQPALHSPDGLQQRWSVLAVTPSGGLRRLPGQPPPAAAASQRPPGTSPTSTPAGQGPAGADAAQQPVAKQPAPGGQVADPQQQQQQQQAGGGVAPDAGTTAIGSLPMAGGGSTAAGGGDACTFMLRAMPEEELLALHNFNGALMAVDEAAGNYTTIMGSHTQKVLMVYSAGDTTHSFAQVLMVELHPHTFEPITEAGISVITYRGRHEDPRLFTWQGKLWMSSTMYRPGTARKVAINQINGKTAGPPLLLDLNDKHGRRDEKNWALFPHAGELMVLYSVQPLRVYAADLATGATKAVVAHAWWKGTGAALRGGAPPVLAGGRYYVFVHSKRPVYEVHAVILDAVSLRVVAWSPEPIIRKGSDRILFPCGALYTPATERFAISMGINDKFTGIVQVSKRHVDKHLVAVQ